MSAQNAKTLGAFRGNGLWKHYNLSLTCHIPDGSRMELVDDAVNAFKKRYEIFG